jgi:1-acyl-sn-glycerol-3-phosphate acyltransferase
MAGSLTRPLSLVTPSSLESMAAALTARAIVAFARIVTGVKGNWVGCKPDSRRRIYYGNHASHGDFVLIWSAIPPRSRPLVRPVAGADYWRTTRTRRFLSDRVFRAVLIDRDPATRTANPVEQMLEALDAGSSLILFPEGTRNTTDEILLPFKAGLFHLAKARPDVEIVPAWIENLNRVMPKGEYFPIPLLCTVTFGAPVALADGEDSAAFLDRAREALLQLSSKRSRT